jgi:hypothetical protein
MRSIIINTAMVAPIKMKKVKKSYKIRNKNLQ